MGLYPDLLPTDYRKQLQYPNPLPTLSGAELEKAHLALIDYLTQVGLTHTVWGPLPRVPPLLLCSSDGGCKRSTGECCGVGVGHLLLPPTSQDH